MAPSGGYEQMRWAIAVTSAMGHREFRVLMILLTFRNARTNTARPSAMTIAKMMGSKDRSGVDESLRRLVQAGVLNVVSGGKGQRGWSTKEYEFVGQVSGEVPTPESQVSGLPPTSEAQVSGEVQTSGEVPTSGLQVSGEVPTSGPDHTSRSGDFSVQVSGEVPNEPLEEPSTASSSREVEYDSAWLGLVWRPRKEALAHATKHHPTVDLYASTVAYIEYVLAKGYDPTNGRWMKWVEEDARRASRVNPGYDEGYDRYVQEQVAEAQRKWNEARGITA